MSTNSRHRRAGASGNRYNVEVTPRKTLDEFRERSGTAKIRQDLVLGVGTLLEFAKSCIRSTVEFVLDLEEDKYDDIRIFPKLAIFLLMTLTFWSRNILVTNFEGLAIVHPDENFQAIEVAHSEVYGYGFRLNAYDDELPSDKYIYEGGSDATANRGHVSWLYVHIYVILFRFREYFRWTASPFVVARTFFSVWSSLLAFAVYKLTRTLFKQSRDIGFIAASLVAFSKHTMIYGTHPFASSFVTTIVIASLTVALRTFPDIEIDSSQRQRCHHQPSQIDNISNFFSVNVCGFALAIALTIKPDSCFAIFGFALLFFPFRLSIVGCLPSRTTLNFMVAFAFGLAVGFATVSAHHHYLFGEWRFPFVAWLKEQLFEYELVRESGFHSAVHTLVSFLRCSHVHIVLTIAVLLLNVCYLLHVTKVTGWFAEFMNSNDVGMFANIFRLGVLTTLICLVYAATSLVRRREYAFAQELMVTSLVAGSAAIYLLFRRLYIYVIELAAPKQVTRNIIKLVLYGELFLYMFESRVTFPGTADQRIADWSYKGCWESAHVNRCLQFVGQQPDVSGVAVNYSLAMTGAYSLIHHDVPIFGRTFGEFREWTGSSRRNISAGIFGARNLSLSTLDGATDIISLDNAAYFYRRLAESSVYNYVVTNGTNARLFRVGFREVYNASDFRVFKRAKSRTERDALVASVAGIAVGTDAQALAEEGRKLTALRLWGKAAERLRASVRLDEVNQVDSWRDLLTALTQLELYDELASSRQICRRHHGEKCMV